MQDVIQQKPTRRRQLLLSGAISVVIVAILAWTLDWKSFAHELARVRWPYLLPLPILLAILLLLRALRWQLLLPPAPRLSLLRLGEATILGFMASFILPLRAGEIIRPYLLSRSQPVPFPMALASIVAERLFDALTLLGLLGLCLLHIPSIPAYVATGARAAAILTGILLALILAGAIFPKAATQGMQVLLQRMLRPSLAQKAVLAFGHFWAGLRGISTLPRLLGVLLYSALLWLLMALWYQVVLWGFGVQPSWWVGMVLNVMIALAVAAPSAPGFIGTFQAGCILGLSVIFGFSREFAVAYSVVAHVLQMGFVLLAGMIVLQARGLHFSQLRSAPA